MIGEVNRGVEALIHTNLRKPLQKCAHYHMSLKTLKNGDSPINDAHIISTNGLIRIKYSPAALRKHKDAPYIFKNDIFERELLRLGGWQDFVNKAKEDERINFFYKYSNVTEESFEIAKANPDVDFYYSVDSIRYCKDLCKAMGIEKRFDLLKTPEMNEAEKLRHKVFLEVNHVYDVEV